jgi:hypothetical protein
LVVHAIAHFDEFNNVVLVVCDDEHRVHRVIDGPGVNAGVDRRAKPLLNFSAWVTNLHSFNADLREDVHSRIMSNARWPPVKRG